MLLAMTFFVMTKCGFRSPTIVIVSTEEATPLERKAANELATMLERRFEVEASVKSSAEKAASSLIYVGRPQSNRALEKLIGSNWPDLSSQGLVLRKIEASTPTLLVGGGSPVAVLWAVYDLMERLGVRYLLNRDVYPSQEAWSGLPELNLVIEPNMQIRSWRLVNDLAHGPVSWSLAENVRFLRQIAKMKYNRIHCSLWPAQPFVHYRFRGMEKPPGVLFFGHQFPIRRDMVGIEKISSMKTFTNPELLGANSSEEVRRRAIGLVRGILDEAKNLGMETGLSIQPFHWPKEFIKVLPGSEEVDQLGDLTAGPGHQQSMQDPLLKEMVRTIFRAYIETYPDIDYLHINMPEHRSWIAQARKAYSKLTTYYQFQDLGSFEELCRSARSRTTFPGGGKRVETMIKGDLSSLWFLDSLMREKNLLKRPGKDDNIKMIFKFIAAELFPLLAKMLPKDGEIVSFVDYTASRQLKQLDLLKQVPPEKIPASLIFTLADDNVGLLPQLATESLHQLMSELRKNDWKGFYTRYWTIGDLDPTTHYLSRASWNPSITPKQAYVDQIQHVCGPDAVESTLKAFAIIEKITLGLDQHGLGFGFPVPEMMIKHFKKEGLSDLLKRDRELYREAREHMEEAHQKSSHQGRAYTGYFFARLHFAVRYLDAAEAFGATARALKIGRKEEALQQVDLAYKAIQEAIQSYADVAKDYGDLGAVALLNEYCYRPIKQKKKDLFFGTN